MSLIMHFIIPIVIVSFSVAFLVISYEEKQQGNKWQSLIIQIPILAFLLMAVKEALISWGVLK